MKKWLVLWAMLWLSAGCNSMGWASNDLSSQVNKSLVDLETVLTHLNKLNSHNGYGLSDCQIKDNFIGCHTASDGPIYVHSTTGKSCSLKKKERTGACTWLANYLSNSLSAWAYCRGGKSSSGEVKSDIQCRLLASK